jgi:hypothetical protein
MRQTELSDRDPMRPGGLARPPNGPTTGRKPPGYESIPQDPGSCGAHPSGYLRTFKEQCG